MSKPEAWELVALLGLGLVGAGLAMVSVPAALVVVGALLLALAVGPVLVAARRR